MQKLSNNLDNDSTSSSVHFNVSLNQIPGILAEIVAVLASLLGSYRQLAITDQSLATLQSEQVSSCFKSENIYLSIHSYNCQLLLRLLLHEVLFVEKSGLPVLVCKKVLATENVLHPIQQVCVIQLLRFQTLSDLNIRLQFQLLIILIKTADPNYQGLKLQTLHSKWELQFRQFRSTQIQCCLKDQMKKKFYARQMAYQHGIEDNHLCSKHQP
ncbi:hypothetical protein FGO68_gene2688 [Halteria grandinella]|uniref:Uncharacterized protein n=1 Tax=Halteria grandinella TaxID=5974 RepID=A0A8J8P2K2_HALGN|nr:hypothetical protein FGO68_gene2688 [Halteria grandinella]